VRIEERRDGRGGTDLNGPAYCAQGSKNIGGNGDIHLEMGYVRVAVTAGECIWRIRVSLGGVCFVLGFESKDITDLESPARDDPSLSRLATVGERLA